MATQGRVLEESEIRTILTLLESTDTEISAIAERMGCSRSTIIAINRRFRVRDYAGRRNSWRLGRKNDDGKQALKTTQE